MVDDDITSSEIFVHFCKFAKIYLIPGGTVQKNMVVYYFRQCFPNAYKYQEQATDDEIERCLSEWNKMTVKAEENAEGMYIGFQINFEYEKKMRAEEKRRAKIKKVKAAIIEAKQTGEKPSMKILKQAVELGIIKLPSKEQMEASKKKEEPVAEEGEEETDPAAEPTTKKVVKKKKKKGDGTTKKKKKKAKGEGEDEDEGELTVDSVDVWKRDANENDDPEKAVKKKVKKKKATGVTKKKKVIKKKKAAPAT